MGGKGVINRGMSSSLGETTQATDASTVVLEIVTEMSPSGVTEVGPDTELVAELGFDSLGLVELLVALEDTLKLPPVDIEALGNVDRVADLQRVFQDAQARMRLTKEA
jgi:acyl carrier protein